MKEMKEMKETVNDAVNMAKNIPSSVSTEKLVLGITVAVLAGGASAVYSFSKWLDKPSCFDKDDLTRHRNLIKSYEKMGINKLDFWTLTNENRPIFKIDYLCVQAQIDRAIDILEKHPSTINFSRRSILLLLSRYLESVDKRTTVADKILFSYERSDGVEAMFLSEMISWLLTKFLELPDVGQNSLETIEKRSKYCREIHLLIPNNNVRDTGRTNFKDMLGTLCLELEHYRDHLANQSKMVDYNSLITELSDSLLAYKSILFNMLYLLTKGASQRRLNVGKFMSPATSDKKNMGMRLTGQGSWLYSSLSTAGIDTATFEPTEELSIEKINAHLQGQHPDDKVCILRPDLLNVKSYKWGHWDFVTAKIPPATDKATSITTAKKAETHQEEKIQKCRDKAAKYLTSIRDINRLALLICHLRKKTGRSKFVTGVFGQVWIYGDPAGKATLDEVLCSVSHDIGLCEEKINPFWEEYFRHYSAYARKNRVDSINYDCHKWLNEINAEGERRVRLVASISKLVERIKENSSALPITKAKANQSLEALYHDVLMHMDFYGKANTDNYRIIKEALDELHQGKPSVSSSGIINTKSPAETQTTHHTNYHDFNEALQVNVLEYKKSALQYYFSVDELLDLNRPIGDDNPLRRFMNYDLVPITTDFRSNEIKNIYSNYLVNNHYEVTSYWLAVFLFSSKISTLKINLFRATYLRINAVFNLLYNPSRGGNQPMDIEIILAETLLRATIENDFWENKYFSCYPFRTTPRLTVEDKNDGSETIEVTLDKKWFNLGEGLLREEVNHLKSVVHDQNQRLSCIAGERDDLRGRLRQKDLEIDDKNKAIADKDQALADKDQVIADKDQALADKDQALVGKDQALNETKTKLVFFEKQCDTLRANQARSANTSSSNAYR